MGGSGGRSRYVRNRGGGRGGERRGGVGRDREGGPHNEACHPWIRVDSLSVGVCG